MSKKLGAFRNEEIRALRELTAQEYAEYKSNLKILIDFSNKQQLFTIINLNYEEFKNLVNTYLIEFKNSPSMNWACTEIMVINTNRVLLNFLSAFRTLLDHMEYILKKDYGNESEEFKKFKKVCSEQYDNYFSYRFLYKLRNYTQHCGMPVGSFTIDSKVSNIESKKVEDYLAVYFDRDTLLNKYDSWGQIKNEIIDLPPKIEINPFVDDVMKCISRINLTVIEHDLEKVFRSTKYFENLLIPFKDIDEIPAIFDINDKYGNQEKLEVNIEWMPLHIIDMVLKVRQDEI